jgi:hypothetical protein
MRQFSRIASTKPGTIRRLATTVLTKNGPQIGWLKMAIRHQKKIMAEISRAGIEV